MVIFIGGLLIPKRIFYSFIAQYRRDERRKKREHEHVRRVFDQRLSTATPDRGGWTGVDDDVLL